MSHPCVEIVYTVPTKAYLAKAGDTVQPAGDLLKNREGTIKVYHGLQVEDPKHAYLVIPWETLEHHKKLMAEKDTYDVLGQHCSLIWSDLSTLKMMHVRPTSEPYKAFEAPVTEIALFTVHKGESKEKVEEYVNTFSKVLAALPPSAGVFGSAWGPVVEYDRVLGLFVGWSSVEASRTAVNTDQGASDLIANIRKIADIQLSIVKLSHWA